MRVRYFLGVALALMVGCSDLSRIAENQCGNHVIEPPEDCDGFADPDPGGPGTHCGARGDALTQCRYVCTRGLATDACPSGWGCGTDGVCRKATGNFLEAPGSPYAIEGDTIQAGDVDGDQILDLMGYSFGDLWVQFGSGGGEFRTGLIVPLVDVVPSPVFADVNADSRMDAVVGSGLGFATLLGQEDRDLIPLAYPAFDVISEIGDRVQYYPLHATPGRPFDDLVALSSRDGTLHLELVALGRGEMVPGSPTPLFELGASRSLFDVAGAIVIANIDTDPAADEEEMALALLGADSVWIYGPTVDKFGLAVMGARAEVVLPSQVAFAGARFLDMDGDDAMDLVVSVDDGTAVALGRGDGSFAEALIDRRFGSHTVLAAADLDGDRRLEYVYGFGIFTTREDGTLEDLPTPSILWRSACVADFNRDGRPDVVGIGYDRGFDVLFSDRSGFFTYGRVATQGNPLELRIGDYDGDGVSDVALLEEADGAHSLSVAFGSLQGLPKTPIVMGRWSQVLTMQPLSADRYRRDGVDDLLIQSTVSEEDGSAFDSVTLMSGTVQRRMVSPFELDAFIDFVRVGHFDGDDLIPDALAITSQAVHVIRGAGKGLFYPSDVRAFPVSSWQLSSFCSSVTTGDLDGDLVHEIVALDGCGGDDAPASLRLARFGGPLESTLEIESHRIEGQPVAYDDRVALADVDLDGKPEVIASFAGRPNEDFTTYEGNRVVLYWNRDGTVDPSDALEISSPGRNIQAARPINADGDGPAELAVVTEDGVVIVELGGSSPSLPTAPTIPLGFAFVRDLVVADVNQDGLDDLVVKGFGRMHVFIAVPHRQ